MTTTRRRLLALVAAAALTLGACSSSDSDGATKDDGPTTTAAPDEGATTTTEAAADPSAAEPGAVATAEPVASSGCGSAATEPVQRAEVKVGDTDRTYLLSTPKEVADNTVPLPLVLDFHGLMEGANVHALNSGLDDYAADEGFIVAFPNGTGTPIHWEVDADRKANPDLVYVDAVLDQLEADLCVDTARVYATGLSNGAFMSSTLACTSGDRFAAVAPVAGITFPEGCEPSRPVPIFTMHGTSDPILGFNGAVDLSSIEEGGADEREYPEPDTGPEAEGYLANARSWAEANGCQPDPTDAEATETVVQRTWDCPVGADVVFDIVDGGGHTWPGSEFSKPLAGIMGATDESFSANEVIWGFFQRFALPAD